MTLLKVIVLYPDFQENDEIFKDFRQIVGVYPTSFTVFFGDLKKKML